MRTKIADFFYLILVAVAVIIMSPLWLVNKAAKRMEEGYGERL